MGVSWQTSFVNKSLMTLSSVDLPYQQYDLIISKDTLNHVADPKRCIKNLSSFLKKDGLLVLTVSSFCQSFFNNATVPRWKMILARKIFKDPNRRVEFAKRHKWFCSHIQETFGIDVITHLWDVFGTNKFASFYYGEILNWLKNSNLEYVASQPCMELNKLFLNQYQLRNKDYKSQRKINNLLRNIILRLYDSFRIEKIYFLNKPTFLSRFLVQLFFFISLLQRPNSITVLAKKKD